MAEPSEDRNNGVPWTDVVRFVRQLSHDLRNHLNAAELQSAYIGEIAEGAELKTEINRLRETMSQLGAVLRNLSAGLGEIKPSLMPYGAAEFVGDLRNTLERDFPNESATITWRVQLGDGALNIDPHLLLQAFTELFANAFQHERGESAIIATAKVDNGHFVFTLCEPKAGFELPTENWGREPLRKITQGHYGLGLNRARVIMEAHDGELRAQYDSAASTLITTIRLPLS
jgi:K+-sensing histidine kinase KdpD